MTKDLKEKLIILSEQFSDLMNITILFIMLIITLGAIGVLARDIILFYHQVSPKVSE